MRAAPQRVRNGLRIQSLLSVHEGRNKPVAYGPWLLHVYVSISWRVLQFFKHETSLEGYDAEAVEAIAKADQAWKDFLPGRSPHPGRFEQHLLPLGAIEYSSAGTDSPSPNINRYLMRIIDKDLCRGSHGSIFVYSKFGRFVLVGFVARYAQINGTVRKYI